ncbi:MAG: COX15/CtaA family protein [Minicystis sp.]
MQRLRRFSWATLGVTLAVILWGAYVRVSGSGAGCGKEWPICKGKLLPTMTSLEMMVEYAHRASSGFVTALVVIQLLWVLRTVPRMHPARKGAIVSTFFIVTEGAVGAAIVLFDRVAQDKSAARAAWMSLHLVNTFLLVASLACTAWWISGRPMPRLRGHGTVGGLVAGGFAGLLAVGVTGALTALGDTLFGAKSIAEGVAADFSPTAHFLQQIRVSHPIVAALVGVYLLYARGAIAARRGPLAQKLSAGLGALVVTQLLLGVVNFMLLAPAWMQMVHLLVADLVWIVFVLLGVTALAERGEEAAIHGAAAPARS